MIKMKTFKKLMGLVLATSLTTGLMVGCGSNKGTDDSEATSESEEGTSDEAEEEPTVVTVGDENGTEFEMWTFVELHAQFYQEMVKEWNEQNPDKTINLKMTVLPFGDMNTKLQSSLLAGKGAPDLCDIEVGQFPNFLKGVPQLETLNDVVEPYKDSIVESRLNLYSKDGNIYGLPTHVGATVAFYNTELLEAAGIDYTTIKTWDDFKEAGSKYYEATGKYLGTADTGTLWTESLMLSELGSDYTDEDGNPIINSDEMKKVLSTLKDLQDSNAIATIAGGQPDMEEAFGEYNKGNYACAIMPMWYMSRFINYMPELSGKIAIAPAPVFEEGQDRSVGGGGTGTVVTKQCENADLAKEFLAFAKLSEEGNVKVWEILGFDPVNTAVWENEEVTNNPDNQYVQYFQNNPFDVLKEIRDEIGLCKIVENTPSINEVLCTTTLNSIFEDGGDVNEELDYAQEEVENAIQ